MPTIQENSFKSVRIEILAERTKAHLSWASGFFCKWQEETFLITNWHIATLQNYQTKKSLHSSGAFPGFFNLHYHSIKTDENGKTSWIETTKTDFELYNFEIEDGEKNYTTPKWHEHPIHGSDIDLVAIKVTGEVSSPPFEVKVFDLDLELKKETKIKVTDKVFVTGFPLNFDTSPNKFPIYKGATIASEPEIYSKYPLFYIDSKTKSGMSGSPVIKKDENITTSVMPDGININQGKIGFIGIYSGRDRQEEDEYKAELGIVWRFQECLIPILEKASS